MAVVVNPQPDWTKVYKQALLERDPNRRERRVEEAYQVMARRRREISSAAPEQQTLMRALNILGMIHVSKRFT